MSKQELVYRRITQKYIENSLLKKSDKQKILFLSVISQG